MISGPDLENAWRYVGRFIWAFAVVESFVNEIFIQLFNLNAAAALMLHDKLDLRRKLRIIELGLKHQGIDHARTLRRVHELHDIRNVIAHCSFGPEDDGVEFDYVSPSGKLTLPGRLKASTDSQEFHWDTKITYSQFDLYDSQARELWDALGKIGGSCTPVGDIEGDLASEIQEAITSPDNVIPFPTRLRPNDKNNH